VDDAVYHRAPPRTLQPRECEPAPRDEQHGAVVVAVQELEVFALADQDEGVNQLGVLGQIEDVDEETKRARQQLARGQFFGWAKKACDAAKSRVLRALEGAKQGADKNNDGKRNHCGVVKHDERTGQTDLDVFPKANHQNVQCGRCGGKNYAGWHRVSPNDKCWRGVVLPKWGDFCEH